METQQNILGQLYTKTKKKNDKRTYVRFPYIYNTTLNTDPKKNENSSS